MAVSQCVSRLVEIYHLLLEALTVIGTNEFTNGTTLVDWASNMRAVRKALIP
jgi:hypothetical protein